MSWQNPILLAPRFQVAGEHDIRLALTGVPEERLRHHAIYPPFGERSGGYVDPERRELVLCQGPLDFDCAIEPLIKDLAPYLGDLIVVAHDEEQVHYTLEGQILEVVVKAGTAQISRRRIHDVIPRARYLDVRLGAQNFHSALELLLACAMRTDASAAVLDWVESEVAERVGYLAEHSTAEAQELLDTPRKLQWVNVLSALGRSVDGLRHTIQEIEARAWAKLFAKLSAFRAPAGDDAATVAGLGNLGSPDEPLATVLRTIGAGTFPDDLVIWDAAAIQRARPQSSELVAFGEHQGKRLYLDVRYVPAPVVIEDDSHAQRWFEEYDSLFSLLASCVSYPVTNGPC